MKLIQHSTGAAFLENVTSFLVRNESFHNVILGVVERGVRDGLPEDVFLGHVEDDRGEIVAAAMRTPPHGAVLSLVDDDDAVRVLVDGFAAQYNSLPTVLGSAEHVPQFAELWQAKCGQSFELRMQQGVYQLDRVVPVTGVSGEAAAPTESYRDVLWRWLKCFLDEALDETRSDEELQRMLDQMLTNARIWVVDGQPVSMVASTRKTPNGACVSYVYTPPEHRGNGYASAVTAAISQELLDAGNQFCFLHTDMANPTSNKIYKAIGYRHMGNQRFYKFADPARTS